MAAITAHSDNDKQPYFDSIEKDANQFEMGRVEFTDIFGIHWLGSKGVHRYVGDADYEVHMYYHDPEAEDDDEYEPVISDTVTAFNVPEGFAKISNHGVEEFVDMANAVDVQYNYIIENHLFKDSNVVVSYDGRLDGSRMPNDNADTVSTWDIYGIAKALKTFKPDLYEKFLGQVDEHFKGLQNSKREEERSFAPKDNNGKYLTAREYFDEVERKASK